VIQIEYVLDTFSSGCCQDTSVVLQPY